MKPSGRYGDFIGDLVGQLDDPVTYGGSALLAGYRIIRQAGLRRNGGPFTWLSALTVPLIVAWPSNSVRTELQQTTLIERFLSSEQRIQGQLAARGHSTPVRCRVTGSSTETPYIVMDYVEGEPVTEYVRREQLATRQKILESLCTDL